MKYIWRVQYKGNSNFGITTVISKVNRLSEKKIENIEDWIPENVESVKEDVIVTDWKLMRKRLV